MDWNDNKIVSAFFYGVLATLIFVAIAAWAANGSSYGDTDSNLDKWDCPRGC